MTKSTFVKNIGNVRLNGIGADLYEKPDGGASIRFDKNTHPMPAFKNVLFDSVADAEAFIEEHTGSNGASTLDNILRISNIDY